jgi:hypothetical protein
MQIFVTFVSGKTIELDVQPTDCVFMIMDMIRDKEGIPPFQQQLIFADTVLEENSMLLRYNIEEGGVLALIQLPSFMITVGFENIEHEQVQIPVTFKTSIKELKQHIAQHTVIREKFMNLVTWDDHDGVLSNSVTMEALGLVEGDMLICYYDDDMSDSQADEEDAGIAGSVERVRISINTPFDDILTVSFPKTSKVEEIKIFLMLEKFYPIKNQQLTFEGNQLEDGLTLAQCNLSSGDTVDMVLVADA